MGKKRRVQEITQSSTPLVESTSVPSTASTAPAIGPLQPPTLRIHVTHCRPKKLRSLWSELSLNAEPGDVIPADRLLMELLKCLKMLDVLKTECDALFAEAGFTPPSVDTDDEDADNALMGLPKSRKLLADLKINLRAYYAWTGFVPAPVDADEEHEDAVPGPAHHLLLGFRELARETAGIKAEFLAYRVLRNSTPPSAQ